MVGLIPEEYRSSVSLACKMPDVEFVRAIGYIENDSDTRVYEDQEL